MTKRKQNGDDANRINPEDHTDIVVVVRGGCVQGAQRSDGTPILVTVHDYDVHEADIGSPHYDIVADEQGKHFERLVPNENGGATNQ